MLYYWGSSFCFFNNYFRLLISFVYSQYSQPSLTDDLVMLAEEHILAVIEP